jgi:hypothetical protein
MVPGVCQPAGLKFEVVRQQNRFIDQLFDLAA